MEENDIFKAEIIYDRMIHSEWVRYYPLVIPRKICISILIELVLLLTLPQFHNEVSIFAFLALSAVFGLAYWLSNRKALHGDYQKILQRSGGLPPHNRIHIRQDGIHLVEPRPGNKQVYSYEDIRAIVPTPKLVMLLTANKKCILLQKSWLMGGTAEQLITFLTAQCPRVRKCRSIRLGQLVRRILIVTMIAGSLFGMILIYGAPIRPEESKSYAEISAELSDLGITIRDETITEVESFYEEYSYLYPESGMTNAEKAQELLYMEGMGEYYPDTMEWTPSNSGVYWMDMEVFLVDSIYTDFFAGLSAMDEELEFSNVREDYSGVDMESGVGTLPVSFDFRGQHYEMEARYNYDWFDSDVLSAVTGIVNSASADKWLCYTFDGGQGFLFYYGTLDDVRALEKLTGLQFGIGSSWFSQIFI